MQSIVTNMDLKTTGKARMEWFRERMPIISDINAMIKENQTFSGKTIAVCMHIEPKTGFWIEGLLAAGAAHVYLVGCLGTTKDDTAAYLASLENITVLGKSTDTYEDHKNYVQQVLANKIDLFLDNGASLILGHHELNPGWNPLGANEETRSGKLLVEKENVNTPYPIVVIDDSPLKQLLENFTGVGQSVVDGFMRSTSLLVGGKNVLVIGFGYCGSGVASKFKGLGANTFVYDVDPLYLLKAKVEGHCVGDLETLLPQADVIVTVTGRFDVLTPEHIPYFKDNAILCNSGHYGFEIDVEGLKAASSNIAPIKKGIEKLDYADKSIYILENASPLNLSAGDGNPIEIMDLGLGLQTLCGIEIVTNIESLTPGLQPVPYEITQNVSRITLDVLK